MSKRVSSDKDIKTYTNIINNLAQDITKNTKVIQTLNSKVTANSNFIKQLNKDKSISKPKALKTHYKNTIESDIKTIKALQKTNERLRQSQQKYISKVKEMKRKSRESRRYSYSTIHSRKSSYGTINSIIGDYSNSKSNTPKELDALLDEVQLMLKANRK